MKFLFLPGFFCCLSILLSAQRNDGLRNITDAQPLSESFKESSYYEKQKLPFRDIVVIDKRFDTTKIGYTNGSSYKIQLGNSWTGILNDYFKFNLDRTSDRTLVIAIRSFWMQRGLLDKIQDKKVVMKDLSRRTEGDMVKLDNGGSCYANLDIYSRSDSSFQALLNIDMCFINASRNFRRNTLNEFFFLPFDSVMRKIAKTDVPDLLNKRRKISAQELTASYANRFDVPVLKDGTPKKGIFVTFDDFKKNTPRDVPFRVKEGSVTDEVYIRNGQTEEVLTNYWGFFDGTDLYIRGGYSVFKAIKQQMTFEIYGSKQISIYHNNAEAGDLKLVSSGVERKILQVNMDTGELY